MFRQRKFRFSRLQVLGLLVYFSALSLFVIFHNYEEATIFQRRHKKSYKERYTFDLSQENIDKILDGKLNFGLIRNIRSEMKIAQNSSIKRLLNEKELEVGQRMKRRTMNIQRLCKEKKYTNCSVDTMIYVRSRLFYEYNATVCTLAKAASSTWRAHLRRVNKVPPLNSPMEDDDIWRAFLSQSREVVLKNVLASNKIITVRHPLTRLVSAYRNKYKEGRKMPRNRPEMENEKREKQAGSYWDDRFYQFWMPALFVNHKVPPDAHIKAGIKDPIDPHVRYTMEEYEKLYDLIDTRLTFPQFLRFVIYQHEIGNPDAHWKSYHDSCCPCEFDYRFVTKTETLSDDLGYVFKVLGIPADPDTAMNQYTSNVNPYKDLKYYDEVPRRLKKELYKWVKGDMELFEYDLPKNFLPYVS